MNVGGVRGSLEEIVQLMDEHHFSFLILGETWLKPMDTLRHSSITFDLRYPSKDPSKGRGIHGLMVVRNIKLTDPQDFEEVERDAVTYSYIWFRFRGMVFGGFYLPPSMDLTSCIECLQSTARLTGSQDYGEPVIMAGDLNMRLGSLTGDLAVNFRSNVWQLIQDLGLSWKPPNTGKWTVCTSRGRSIVDYIFCNQEATELVSSCKVWEDEFIAGSDHRLVSCVTKYWHPSVRTYHECARNSNIPTPIRRVHKMDLKDPLLSTAVARKFKEGRRGAKRAVTAVLGPLTTPGYVTKREEAQMRIDSASRHILDYIQGSMEKGGIIPRPVQYGRSKPFWDSTLSVIKRERNRHWKAARSQPEGSDVAVFLENAARAAHRLLKKEVRRRKRAGFVAFTDAVGSKPVTEAMRQINSIRRRLQDPTGTPGPGLTVDKLDTYADHIAQVFGESSWIGPPNEDIVVGKAPWLTYPRLMRVVKCMPNNKAPGPDGILAEILKLGGQALVSVMYPLYRAICGSGLVPSDWNAAALQLIWKAKGRRDNVEMYRPIALTSIFRKVLEKSMMPMLHKLEGSLDIAQGGFRKGSSTYDMILALDMIIRDNSRKKRPTWQAFLDIKGAYDTVNRDILWQRCRSLGIEGGVYNLLRSLFNCASVMVRIGGQESRRIQLGRGLLQGSVLSPILFNVFIDTLPRLLRRKHPCYSLGGCKINSLLYADDIELVASSRDTLQNMLDTCELHSINHGYVFSPPKCEVIAPSTERSSILSLYGQEVMQAQTFKYLGVPVTTKGIDVQLMCISGITRAIKTANLLTTVGCNGTGFAPATNRWILTTIVRPQMEYGLGLTFLGTGLENVLNKAWSRIWRKALSLPPTASGSATLKMMGVPDMAYRARKLNALMSMRAYKSNADTLLGNVHRYATTGAGRKTRKSLTVRTRRNPLTRNEAHGPRKWRIEEAEYINKLGSQTPGSMAGRIKSRGTRIDTFLRSAKYLLAHKRVARKLVLWRIGIIPGKPQTCQGCDTGSMTTRDHIIMCSGLEKEMSSKVYNKTREGSNTLEAALNDNRIWRNPKTWTVVKKGLQTAWSKSLGRIWEPGYESSPTAEQIRGNS